MKKIFSVFVIIILILCLAGCEDTNPNIEGSQDDTHIDFWTDKETGVQYVIYDRKGGNAGMGGITPRLNADGSLYTDHETEKGGAEE